MTTKLRPTILLIENDTAITQWHQRILKNEPIKLEHIDTGAAALQYLQQQTTPVLILLRLNLPDVDGTKIIKHVKQHRLNCAIIAFTTKPSAETILKAARYGAIDYLENPLDANQLLDTLNKALHWEIQPERIIPNKTIKKYHQFIGNSTPMHTIYQIIDNVATSKASILITGENGTGKELCADALHKESKRADQPFITLDCAAIPKELMESQLFGHVKGAFTGAITDRQGAASQADGGTLFLDEIGEMPLDLQSTLLRFIQTKTFRKVGSDKLERVDIRFISATNRDLEAEIEAKRFREDLFHRLNVIHIQLPALRIRGNDILLLAQNFLDRLAKLEEKTCKGFSADAQQVLLDYHWPGNVRQLENAIYRALLTVGENEAITGERLRALIGEKNLNKQPANSAPPAAAVPVQDISVAITADNSLRSFEEIRAEVLSKALGFCHGNVKRTAKLLKIGPATIYRYQKKCNSPKPEEKLSF